MADEAATPGGLNEQVSLLASYSSLRAPNSPEYVVRLFSDHSSVYTFTFQSWKQLKTTEHFDLHYKVREMGFD